LNIPSNPYASAPPHARRRFVQGLAAGGLLLGLSPFTSPSLLREARAAEPGRAVPELRGTEFHLEVAELPVNYTGAPRLGVAINGSIPAPTLRWREGEEVTIRVTNRMREDTSIHWHGIILPYQMDGVPGISFAGIPPGATFTYRFKVEQSGTYWYHSHSNMQEAVGMYGAIIVEPRGGERIRADRDHVVLLSDWTDEDLMQVMHKLKVHSAYYNHHQPTVVDFFRDVSGDGLKAALDKRRMWNEMRMSPTDLGDLSAATLTYLMNGSTPEGNWTGLFRPGERVRLRFINGSAHTFYDVRIPGLKLTIVQTDGVDVEPVTVDEFRFGPGETYDALVQPRDDAYTVFAQSMERTGYARGTLATRAGLQAEVPAPDPRVWLGMTDMMGGMDHGSMDHGAQGHGETAGGGEHAGMGHGSPGMASMDHAGHGMEPCRPPRTRWPAQPTSRATHAPSTARAPTCGWTWRAPTSTTRVSVCATTAGAC
jgi:CopA family copper-resistance protein